jgi:transposase
MRTYKPRSTYRLGRMRRAAGLRAQGKSLREIARILHVHHDTVWRDLRRWDEEEANVTRLSDRLSEKTPPGVNNPTAGSDSAATVTPIRRRA